MPEPRGSSARPFDPITFGVSAAVTAAFVLWAVVAPTSFSDTINAVFSWTTTQWGWLYLLTAFLLVVASFLLLVTDLGKMRLGRPDDRPEFSNFSWFAMLFGAAIAAGIIFWGPAEPAYHYMTPPPYFGGAAKTPEAAANAMTQSFFHWGLSAWAIYLMLTVPLAHACYTKDLPFRFSNAFYYVLGDRIFGVWGKGPGCGRARSQALRFAAQAPGGRAGSMATHRNTHHLAVQTPEALRGEPRGRTRLSARPLAPPPASDPMDGNLV